MNPTRDVTVSYVKFINELTDELMFMRADGTSYRRETAKLLLFAAKQAKSVKPFFDRKVTYETVVQLLPTKDLERLKDIAKMLHAVLLDLHSKANQSDELKARLTGRARKRKSLKLIPVVYTRQEP